MSPVGEVFIWRPRFFKVDSCIVNGAWKQEKKKNGEERMHGNSLTDALMNMPLGYDKKERENVY